jgi:hypothetical protein
MASYAARRELTIQEKTYAAGETVPGAESFPHLLSMVATGLLRKLPGGPRPDGPLLVAGHGFIHQGRTVKRGDPIDEALRWPHLKAALEAGTVRLAPGVEQAHVDEAVLEGRTAPTAAEPAKPRVRRPNRTEARS